MGGCGLKEVKLLGCGSSGGGVGCDANGMWSWWWLWWWCNGGACGSVAGVAWWWSG